jgi:CMP-N-acetylneuraminic acid synthetase
MINGLNILAVIPARGGSKRILLKNLKKVGCVAPMVERKTLDYATPKEEFFRKLFGVNCVLQG